MPQPGFSEDGLSYSVANDLPKIMAQISAEYAARANEPRYNPFGSSPDSPKALYDELIAPNAWYLGAMNQKPVEAKTFEVGNRVIQVDPRTQQVRELYAAPAAAEKPKRYAGPTTVGTMINPSVKANLTLPEWKSIEHLLPDEVRTNMPVSGYLGWANQATQSVPTTPAQVAVPKMAIGESSTPLQQVQTTTPSPLVGGMQIGSWTGNAFQQPSEAIRIESQPTTPGGSRPRARWARDASGKMVRVE
jgi:hypothetical protein